MARKRKAVMGRPPKVAGGLGRAALYMRCTPDFLVRLDAATEQLRAETGATLSRSDVARMLLTHALDARKP